MHMASWPHQETRSLAIAPLILHARLFVITAYYNTRLICMQNADNSTKSTADILRSLSMTIASDGAS